MNSINHDGQIVGVSIPFREWQRNKYITLQNIYNEKWMFIKQWNVNVYKLKETPEKSGVSFSSFSCLRDI